MAVASESIEDLFARYGPSYRWFVTVGGLLASFTMVFSATIVNVAVPDVMGAFGVGQDQAQWLGTAFVATMTASQLLNAWFVERLGQRVAFLTTLTVFTTGTILAGSGPNLDVIILGRVLQGFSAGVIQPLVMVTLFEVYPPNRRGSAMAVFGMGLVLALGIGPSIGGITIDTFHWRWVFFVPLPLVFIAFIMGSLFMPSKRHSIVRTPFDWTGYILLCAALFCLMTAVASGPREGWTSDYILTLLIGGIGAAGAFIASQLMALSDHRAVSPLLNLRLFRNPAFASAVLVGFVFGIGNFSSTYAIPIFGQTIQNFTPTWAGMVLLPAGLVVVLIFPFTGRLVDSLEVRIPLMGGLLMFALGTYLMSSADSNTSYWSFAIYAMIGRAGMAFINPAMNKAALESLPDGRLNQGAGTINFCRQLGGATGINSFVTFLEIRTRFHADALTATQTAGNASSRELLGHVGSLLNEAGVPPAQHYSGALDYLGKMVHAQASMLGFQDSFFVVAFVFTLALIPAWILGRAAARIRAERAAAG